MTCQGGRAWESCPGLLDLGPEDPIEDLYCRNPSHCGLVAPSSRPSKYLCRYGTTYVVTWGENFLICMWHKGSEEKRTVISGHTVMLLGASKDNNKDEMGRAIYRYLC